MIFILVYQIIWCTHWGQEEPILVYTLLCCKPVYCYCYHWARYQNSVPFVWHDRPRIFALFTQHNRFFLKIQYLLSEQISWACQIKLKQAIHRVQDFGIPPGVNFQQERSPWDNLLMPYPVCNNCPFNILWILQLWINEMLIIIKMHSFLFSVDCIICSEWKRNLLIISVWTIISLGSWTEDWAN